MKSTLLIFKINPSHKRIFYALLLCVSMLQASMATEQKDTVIVLQKKGKDRRYYKNCQGENILMVCAFRKHGLTVLSEKTGVEFPIVDQYTLKFYEGTSLLSFLLSIESKNKNHYTQK